MARAERIAFVLGPESDLVDQYIFDAKALNDAVSKVESTFRDLRCSALEVMSQSEWTQLIRIDLPNE